MNSPYKKNSFRQKVEKMYYNYGKFAASHPIFMLIGVIIVILISWYPLPNAFIMNSAPYEQQRIKLKNLAGSEFNDSKFIGYVQQVIVQNRATLMSDTTLSSPIEMAYSALSECFSIVNRIKKIPDFLDHCYSTGDVSGTAQLDEEEAFSVFPTHSCMLLSPVSLWRDNSDQFWADANILKTISSRHLFVKEMAFGLPWRRTGLGRYYTGKKFYKLNYVITFMLRRYDKRFMDQLFTELQRKYNVTVYEPRNLAEEILYIDLTYLSAHTTLLFTYMVLILYVYFSVRKIEMVKSKIGLAFSACFTVASSLYMSLGICIYMGIVVPTLPGSEIFPYLVLIIGLENTLVITKSVVATPVDLPVKHRIAQGLEKEGWAITKNLFSEILIFSLGIFTFNPAIQEFFMLALIGLAVDFFLQITFFVTVLSIDMRRIELGDIRDMQQSQLLRQHQHQLDVHLGKHNRDSLYTHMLQWVCEKRDDLLASVWQLAGDASTVSTGSGAAAGSVVPASSASSINSSTTNVDSTTIKGHKRKASDINTSAFIQSGGLVPVYIPRRLIFLYFWAKSRIFQKLMMITAAFWILMIILYSTRVFENRFLLETLNLASSEHDTVSSNMRQSAGSNPVVRAPAAADDDDYGDDLHQEWKLMAMHHWPRLARLYQINITNHKLIVLPPWGMMYRVSPSLHAPLHRPQRKQQQHTSQETWLAASPGEILLQQLPTSLRGGWADWGLTLQMVAASICGVGIVLLATLLVMAALQALQNLISADNREPVLRILPLRIHSDFSVPPGVTCLAAGATIVAGGMAIKSTDHVECLLRCWSIETGLLLSERLVGSPRESVWCLQPVGFSAVASSPTTSYGAVARILVAFNNPRLQLCVAKPTAASSGALTKLDELTMSDTQGGVVCMRLWDENTIIAGTVRGWIMTIAIDDTNRIRVLYSQRPCREAVRDIHFSRHQTLAISTQKSIMILYLPCLTLCQQIDIQEETVLATHYTENLLAASLANGMLQLWRLSPMVIGQPITEKNQSPCWSWQPPIGSAPVHWLRCVHQHSRHCGRVILATFDLAGTIYLWHEQRHTFVRQIIISPPGLNHPGPITQLPDGGGHGKGSCLVFVDHGYLRLFNVHLNKYERSIQILQGNHNTGSQSSSPRQRLEEQKSLAQCGSSDYNISQLHIVPQKWIVCLDSGLDSSSVLVLPISTIS